jgi:hypothetical protein
LALGGGVLSRSLEYRDDRFSTLEAHRVEAAPYWAVRARLYPGALLGNGTLAHLSLDAQFDRSAFLETRDAGEPLETHIQGAYWGVGARLPLGNHEVSATLGFGRDVVSVERAAEASAFVQRVPSVAYTYLRPGVAARFRLDRFTWGARLGYRALGATGELGSSDWFPHLRGSGQDVELYAGLAASRAVELRLVFEGERYSFKLRPSPDDPRALANQVAGGAVDLSVHGGLALVFFPVALAQRGRVAPEKVP